MPTREDFISIIRRYQSGNATPDEIKFVEQYYDWYDAEEGISASLSESEKKALKVKMLSGIHAQRETPVIQMKRNRLLRVAVAAAIILIAGAGYWFIVKERKQDQSIAKEVLKNDVLPGVNRATLTLDNGRQIVIEKDKNGLLASEGATAIQNQNGSLIYNGKRENIERFNILTTHKGERSGVTLSDGTIVYVDAATQLKFPVQFIGNSRIVELIDGQAWFEVAKDDTKPFYVKKGDKTVQVFGTHFNVMAYGNESDMKVTLVEGSVKVSNGKSTTMITPGSQAVLSNSNENLHVIKDADVEQATAWKNGQFAFHQVDLSTILRELERWYDVTVEINGTLPGKTFVLDGSRKANLSELLRGFEVNHIPYRIDGEKRKLVVNP
ncbi:MAG: FecR domain-containing protein [Bacteroidota bacterium]